jgi:hypothetical protein
MKGPGKTDLAAKVGVARPSVENQEGLTAVQFLFEFFDGEAILGLSGNRLE